MSNRAALYKSAGVLRRGEVQPELAFSDPLFPVNKAFVHAAYIGP